MFTYLLSYPKILKLQVFRMVTVFDFCVSAGKSLSKGKGMVLLVQFSLKNLFYVSKSTESIVGWRLHKRHHPLPPVEIFPWYEFNVWWMSIKRNLTKMYRPWKLFMVEQQPYKNIFWTFIFLWHNLRKISKFNKNLNSERVVMTG